MRLHLAGCECEKYYTCAKLAGARSFLMSYWYAFHKKKNCKKALSILADAGDNWIMDSGLFTMMFGSESHRKYTEEELATYTRAYLAKMKEIAFKGAIVEMDVHKVLGLEALGRFRRIFEREWPLDRTIYVYHAEERISGLKRMAKRYPYIALSIPELRNIVKHVSVERYLYQLLNVAHMANPNVRIHLLGNTQLNLMQSGLYDTCDSTSWKYPAILNTLDRIEFQDGKAKRCSYRIKKDGVRNLDAIFKKACVPGFTADSKILKYIRARDYLKTATVSAANFLMLERRINERYCMVGSRGR